MVKANLVRHTAKAPVVAQQGKRPPTFKARVDIVDLTLRKRVASIVGYGETLDVIQQMRRECAWAVRNGGRYTCSEPEVSFLRYGSPHTTPVLTFFEEPVDMEQTDQAAAGQADFDPSVYSIDSSGYDTDDDEWGPDNHV